MNLPANIRKLDCNQLHDAIQHIRSLTILAQWVERLRKESIGSENHVWPMPNTQPGEDQITSLGTLLSMQRQKLDELEKLVTY